MNAILTLSKFMTFATWVAAKVGAIATKIATWVVGAINWLGDLLEAIGEAFGDLGTLILNFIKDGFTTLFLEVSDGTIVGPSNLALFMFFTIGIALVIGLTTLVFRILRNKGKI